MRLSRAIARGLRALTHRTAADQDVSDEVAHYLEQATAAHLARGLSRADALRAARLEIGNVTVTREQVRTSGWEDTIETLAADLRYALRRLRSNPAFTTVTVLTLALGIGATTAIFSAVDPILLEPLPYPHANRLVTINDRRQDGSAVAPTFGTFSELRARLRTFDVLAATDRWQPALTGTAEPERLEGQRVSATYFRALGVTLAVGRNFTDDEDVVGGPKVAILTDRLVQRRFGGDRGIVGRTVMLDDRAYLVVGITPRGFSNVMAPSADVWAPLQERAHAPPNSREWGHHYQIVGRLRPAVSLEAARQEIDGLGRSPVAEFVRPSWADMTGGMLVRALQDEITGETRPALYAIIGAVLLLLTIACVNVANLLVARGAQRRAEFAMRVALGASRTRLLRQLLTESLVLSGIGGVLGLAVAQVGTQALVALSPPGLPRADAIGLSGRVLLFALTVTTLVGLVAGFVPASGAVRTGLRERLQDGARGSSARTGVARRALVVAEVALALVLLVGAGLLMRSLERLFAVSPGISPSRLITMQVIAAGHAYDADSARQRFFERALEAVRQVPGVTAAAFTSQLPLSDDLDGYGFELQSRPTVQPGDDGSALRYAVSPGYFAAIGIPLREGRVLDVNDAPGRPVSVVISESFARRAFEGRNPIGQRVRFGPEVGGARGDVWDVIVGVVGDVKQQSLALSQTDAFYVASSQWVWVDNVQSLVARTSGDPVALVPSIKRAIWSVDAQQPIERVVTLDALIAATASQRRFALVVIETFALAALALAAIGMYGVISGSVTERVREIGIRTALGATSRDILGQVVGSGLRLAVLGVVIGLAGASAATRLLDSMLFGISRLDPLTYVGVTVLLAAVAVVASWAPAQRASRIDPVITLRSE